MALLSAAGAVGVAGGAVDLGERVESQLPFPSMPLAGAALFALVTVPMAVSAVAAWRGARRAGLAVSVAGAFLMGWIVGQVLIIRTFTVLQPACFAYGALLALLGLQVRRGEGS